LFFEHRQVLFFQHGAYGGYDHGGMISGVTGGVLEVHQQAGRDQFDRCARRNFNPVGCDIHFRESIVQEMLFDILALVELD
jgi:hypothetical protein